MTSISPGVINICPSLNGNVGRLIPQSFFPPRMRPYENSQSRYPIICSLLKTLDKRRWLKNFKDEAQLDCGAKLDLILIKDFSGFRHFLDQACGFKAETVLFFQYFKFFVNIFNPPFVCISENPTPIGWKTEAVDQGQIHILWPITDALFHNECGLVDAQGKHDVHNLLFGHCLGCAEFLSRYC